MSFAFLFCSKSALPYGKPHESLSNIARTFPSVKKYYSTSQVVGTANASLDLSPFLKQIEDIVKGSDVVLFMKGRPEAPQCGFSRAAAQILSQFPIQVAAVDVLEHAGIREAVKKYSSWPTIPQIFIKGEFVGGCDILMDMYRQGQLESLFKERGLLEEKLSEEQK